MHRGGAEAEVNRSQNAQQGAPAPAPGVVVVGPPPDEHSQMQINSDLGSQIPALLAVLKIAQRSAALASITPIDPRSRGRSSRIPQRIPRCLPGPASPKGVCMTGTPPPHCPRPLLTLLSCREVIYCSTARQAAGARPGRCAAAPGVRRAASDTGRSSELSGHGALGSPRPWFGEGLNSKMGRGGLADVAGSEGTCWSSGLCSASGSPAALGISQVLMHGLIHKCQWGWERENSLAVLGKLPAPRKHCRTPA